METKRAWSGALLVTGTCIGAGMLALPLTTGIAGLLPAIAINALCWILMMATGLLFMEATLWMPDGANVITMSERFLGKPGKILGGLSFVFLYYCLMVAYMAEGVPLFQDMIQTLSDLSLSTPVASLLFFGLFMLIVFMGTRVIDRINWILITSLVISFFLLLFTGIEDITPSFYQRKSFLISFLALPTLFSAYGYHNIIPTISTYLNRRPLALKKAIVLGTLIPFVVYSSWQALVIGIVPEADLIEAAQVGTPVSQLIEQTSQFHLVAKLSLFFGFFALVTSILGVSMSMVDFLGDGMGVQNRTGWKRILLCALVFMPPLLFSYDNPKIFLDALEYAGGYGEAFLNGILPAAMVWVGRYKMNLESPYSLPGGKASLIMIFILTFGVTLIVSRHIFL